MPQAKLTSKGQITIPKAVREQLGLRTGDEVEFVIEDGNCQFRKKVRTSPFEKWQGAWKGWEGRTTEEIMRELRGHDAEDDRLVSGDAGR